MIVLQVIVEVATGSEVGLLAGPGPGPQCSASVHIGADVTGTLGLRRYSRDSSDTTSVT